MFVFQLKGRSFQTGELHGKKVGNAAFSTAIAGLPTEWTAGVAHVRKQDSQVGNATSPSRDNDNLDRSESSDPCVGTVYAIRMDALFYTSYILQ